MYLSEGIVINTTCLEEMVHLPNGKALRGKKNDYSLKYFLELILSSEE